MNVSRSSSTHRGIVVRMFSLDVLIHLHLPSWIPSSDRIVAAMGKRRHRYCMKQYSREVADTQREIIAYVDLRTQTPRKQDLPMSKQHDLGQAGR